MIGMAPYHSQNRTQDWTWPNLGTRNNLNLFICSAEEVLTDLFQNLGPLGQKARFSGHDIIKTMHDQSF